MPEVELPEILEQAHEAYRLREIGKLDEAKALSLLIEAKQNNYADEREKAVCRNYVAPCLVDIGYAVNDEGMVKRGTSYFQDWVDNFAKEEELASGFYNLANGYLFSWEFSAQKLISNATDGEEHRSARHYYRQAAQRLQPKHYTNGLAAQLWTNYGNALDSVGRSVEAIDAYDAALHINPDMGMALGNKARAISYLSPIVHGHRHLFHLEAIRLLEKAMEQPLASQSKASFTQLLEQLNEFLRQHGEMKPEEIKSMEPKTDFHRHLCQFCAKHGLFLNPVTFLGEEKRAYYGDPIYITTMYAPIRAYA